MIRLKFFIVFIIAIVVFCTISSCNEEPLTSDISPTSLFGFKGRIENWSYGDSVNIHCVSIHVDYPLGGYNNWEIFSSSAINRNGEFSLTLRGPQIWDSLYGYSYNFLFPKDNCSDYFISDTNARFELSMFQFYSFNWVNMRLRIRNRSFNFSSISDSMIRVGDYFCGTNYYWTDRNVTIRYNYLNVFADTTSINADLEFSKGWNKIVGTLKTKRNKFIQIEERVNNTFEGKYFVIPE